MENKKLRKPVVSLDWGGIKVVLIFLITCAIYFCPFVICLLTGNWWFLLLFFVTWTPAMIFFMLAYALFVE